MALRSLICGIRKLTFLFPLLHVRLGCIFGREFPKAIDGESVADPTRKPTTSLRFGSKFR
jgi:hypothetical protein